MTNEKKSAITKKRELTEAQSDFLDLCQRIGYGEISKVIVQNGEPVYAYTSEHGHKFG